MSMFPATTAIIAILPSVSGSTATTPVSCRPDSIACPMPIVNRIVSMPARNRVFLFIVFSLPE